MPCEVPLVDGIAPPGNSFVVPDKKLVYISTTKVACTSLRWMVADLAGENLTSFHSAVSAHQSRLMTIHGPRSRWRKTLRLSELPREALGQIHPDNGWFIFAVVRDPWSRFWSAWQSKFLVRQTYYVRHYGDQPWFPRVPSRARDVIEDFHTFFRARPWAANDRLAKDRHFLPQVRSVQPKHINYTKIYDVRHLRILFEDLERHLAALGQSQDLYFPRANETPLPLTEDVLTTEFVDFVRERYAPDFAAFSSHEWSPDSIPKSGVQWSAAAIEHVAYHTAANQRIGDLSRTARDLEAALKTERARSAALAKRLAADGGESPATHQTADAAATDLPSLSGVRSIRRKWLELRRGVAAQR